MHGGPQGGFRETTAAASYRALPLRPDPGQLRPPQGPWPQDPCQQGSPCDLLTFKQETWPLRLPCALRCLGQVVRARVWFVRFLVDAGLVLNTFGLSLGNNPGQG